MGIVCIGGEIRIRYLQNRIYGCRWFAKRLFVKNANKVSEQFIARVIVQTHLAHKAMKSSNAAPCTVPRKESTERCYLHSSRQRTDMLVQWVTGPCFRGLLTTAIFTSFLPRVSVRRTDWRRSSLFFTFAEAAAEQRRNPAVHRFVS